jgi:hypothetical protein
MWGCLKFAHAEKDHAKLDHAQPNQGLHRQITISVLFW